MAEASRLLICEVRAFQIAHSLRMKNNGVLLALNLQLEPEPVDDETWVKRTAANAIAIQLLSGKNVLDALTQEYGDIFCPIECPGSERINGGFLDCPTTGQSVYLG